MPAGGMTTINLDARVGSIDLGTLLRTDFRLYAAGVATPVHVENVVPVPEL